MQMLRICVCYTYADVRHMDMFGVCLHLSFSAEIRKKAEPEPYMIVLKLSHKTRLSRLTGA